MTEILIDPEELAGTAALLRNVTTQLSELGGGLGGVCCCEMPVGLDAYVGTELGAVSSLVGEAASGYGTAADDLATRSGLIASDQSMVGAMSSAYGGPVAGTDANGYPTTAGWLDGVSGDGPAGGGYPTTTGWLEGVSGDGPGGGSFPGTGGWTGAVSGDGAAGGGYPTTADWTGGVTGEGPGSVYEIPDTTHWGDGLNGGGPIATPGSMIAGGNSGSTILNLGTAAGSVNATWGSTPDIHVNTAGGIVDNAGRVTNSISGTSQDPATGRWRVT